VSADARSADDRIRIAAWCVGGYLASLGVGVAYARSLQRAGSWTKGFQWEHDLLTALHAVVLPQPIDMMLLLLPWFGTNITLLPLSMAAAIWLVRRGYRRLAMHLLVLQVGTLTLSAVLKFSYDRPRPMLWEWRGQFAWASYPSGHAIVSVAVPFTIAIMIWRALGWRWPFIVATVLLLVSIYSRLYLGVHWPTDVIAGVLMGAVWLIATLMAFRSPMPRVATGTP
jgi:undecaprenyl-diphosphatase